MEGDDIGRQGDASASRGKIEFRIVRQNEQAPAASASLAHPLHSESLNLQQELLGVVMGNFMGSQEVVRTQSAPISTIRRCFYLIFSI
jgi:hypothetical protein